VPVPEWGESGTADGAVGVVTVGHWLFSFSVALAALLVAPRVFPAIIRLKRWISSRRPVTWTITQEQENEFWTASGESLLFDIQNSEGGTAIEVETPDGLEVWALNASEELDPLDLAVAARVRFGSQDYYRLHHVGRRSDLAVGVPVAKQVTEGDRLRAIINDGQVWGLTHRPSLTKRVGFRLRRLVSQKKRIE